MIVNQKMLELHLNIESQGSGRDAFMELTIQSAQAHIERLLGFKIEETFGGVDQDPVPADLTQAVMMLAAHWWENREASLVGVGAQEVPFGVHDIVLQHREWTF